MGKQQRQMQRLQESLRTIDQTIKLNKTGVVTVVPPPRYLEVVEPPPVRPPTPSVEGDDPDDVDLPILALQQFLRGRAIQNEMFEGKERRQELVQELRSTHALRDNEKLVTQQQQQALDKTRDALRADGTREALGLAAVSEMQGSNVGSMLDFLSKELVRLQEERRIHAFAMMAERQRRMREAEESGKRQIEEQRRQQQDEVFRQVVQVHQATVDSYLEDLILGAKAASADQQGAMYCIVPCIVLQLCMIHDMSIYKHIVF
jgi:hypothetical protein